MQVKVLDVGFLVVVNRDALSLVEAAFAVFLQIRLAMFVRISLS